MVDAAWAQAQLQAQGQWTWRDKNGRVTASDLPPPRDVPDKDIMVRPVPRLVPRTPASAAAAAASGASAAAPGVVAAPGVPGAPGAPAVPVERELDARKKAAEADKAAKTRADDVKQAGARADNCRRARTQLTALDGGQRIARLNDQGEREVLDDKGRAEETRRARDIIASDCKTGLN